MPYSETDELKPGELVRQFRESYVNLYRLWSDREAVPEGVVLRTPRQEKLAESHLPEALRAQLQAYREANPKEKITLIKYMRSVNGRPERVIEDDSDLPPEDSLLTMSQTVTINSIDTVQVITDLFVARRG